MKLKIILLILFVGIFIYFPKNVFAEKINSFDVEITAHKDGKMDVVERIDYDFENIFRHGIFRFIPRYSKVGNLYRIINVRNLKVERDGKEENYTSVRNNDEFYYKIGDADKTITGAHKYKISYTVDNGIGSNYSDHDEIYWNATGNGWEVPITSASLFLKTDGPIIEKVKCYIAVGVDAYQFCKSDENNLGLVKSTDVINPGNGLTVVYGFPVNSFPKSILSTDPPMSITEKFIKFIWQNIIIVWGIINIFIPIGLIIWYQKKKNKKRFGSPAVNFELPKDEKGKRIYPALAGAIDNSKLDRDDVIATIFDLAIRKYIKLEEKVEKKLGIFGDDKKQKIVKLKDKDKNLNKFEEILFEKLFETGDSVYVDTLKLDFYLTFEKLETQLFNDLIEKKYYVKNPKIQRSFLRIVGLLAIFTFNPVLGVVLFYLSRKLIGRTALGDEVDYKIDGLKLFLNSMDRNYKWQAEKFYTVEQMIPFAIGLGFIDKLMEQLKLIKPDYNPSWYSGGNRGFYAFYPAFASTMSSSVTTSAPSSSSGFSGGSSGGGGGGGGGGSW